MNLDHFLKKGRENQVFPKLFQTDICSYRIASLLKRNVLNIDILLRLDYRDAVLMPLYLIGLGIHLLKVDRNMIILRSF